MSARFTGPHAPSASRPVVALRHARRAITRLEERAHVLGARHAVALLRTAIGAIFFGFGVLKFFPGVSPAQGLAEDTTHLLTFGLVPGGVAIVVIATLECAIGLCFIAGRGMRLALLLLGGEFVGILSPIVLLPGRMFDGPHHAPSLEGQYVLKDVVLVVAALVIAVVQRGGRLVPDPSVEQRVIEADRRRWASRPRTALPRSLPSFAVPVIGVALVAGVAMFATLTGGGAARRPVPAPVAAVSIASPAAWQAAAQDAAPTRH